MTNGATEEPFVFDPDLFLLLLKEDFKNNYTATANTILWPYAQACEKNPSLASEKILKGLIQIGQDDLHNKQGKGFSLDQHFALLGAMYAICKAQEGKVITWPLVRYLRDFAKRKEPSPQVLKRTKAPVLLACLIADKKPDYVGPDFVRDICAGEEFDRDVLQTFKDQICRQFPSYAVYARPEVARTHFEKGLAATNKKHTP